MVMGFLVEGFLVSFVCGPGQHTMTDLLGLIFQELFKLI